MPRRKYGLLIIISGPSGVGKGTICEALIKRHQPYIKPSISATTRPPRAGEVDGREYNFISQEAFESMIEGGEFLEYMRLFNNRYYGTPKAFVEEERLAGNDILLEIDVNGAMMVKSACPDALLVFIAPPSMAELHARLSKRGTEEVADVAQRLKTAMEEVKFMDQYEYVVVNDELTRAVDEASAIIFAEKHRVSRNRDFIKKLQGETI